MEYEELHNTVKEYQRGNTLAAGKIIKSYDKYINIFIDIISEGRIIFKHKTAIKFVNLFTKSNLLKFDFNDRWSIVETVNNINYLYKTSTLNKIDLRTEAITVLLSLAKNYNSDKPVFHMYIDKVFYIYYKESLSKFLFDELNNYKIIEKDYLIHYDKYWLSEYDDENVGNMDWILGKTCGDIFKDLSILDRKIIKLSFIDGLTDTEIAKKIGYRSRSSLNKRKNRIKTRIENYGKNDKVLSMW
jgi:AraC-like DNA-binding protein